MQVLERLDGVATRLEKIVARADALERAGARRFRVATPRFVDLEHHAARVEDGDVVLQRREQRAIELHRAVARARDDRDAENGQRRQQQKELDIEHVVIDRRREERHRTPVGPPQAAPATVVSAKLAPPVTESQRAPR